MHLRSGRTKPPTMPKATPAALRLLQLPPHLLHQYSLWTLLRPKAHSRRLPAGRAHLGPAKMKTHTSRASMDPSTVLRSQRMRGSLLLRSFLGLDFQFDQLPRLSHPSLDNIRGEHSVSAHANLRMERVDHRALGHHHLWCDKVNEKIISSTVLLVCSHSSFEIS